MRLPPLPGELRWAVEPVSGSAADGELVVTAGARTDLFADPADGPVVTNAPRLLMRAGGDFLLSARVRVGFAATFDAGVLVAWQAEERWAKLCFEYAPQSIGTIVSVVTRTVSDDANSLPVDDDAVWLRIARLGPALAFHASAEGGFWHLIRHFRLEGELEVGFLAQSPTGAGCTATFDRIAFSQERLADLRSGV